MHWTKIGLLVALAVLTGCRRSEQVLNGTGATSINPIMNKWAKEYQLAKACQINYEPIGSSAGAKRFATGLFDFSCTDAPMNDAQAAAIKKTGDFLYIPLVLGAVVPAYNLPDVQEPLTFSGTILADMFLGKVKRWNDKAIQELNPSIKLPDTAIAIVHRSDGSGTTYVWTDYLSKMNAEWKEKVGVGMVVKWPVGHGRAGSAAVADQIKSTPGGLGYLQLDFAVHDKIGVGLVKNRAGTPVRADPSSVTAAAKSSLSEIPSDLLFSITDAPGKDAYPIAGAVWAMVYVKQPADKGKLLADFLRWATQEGQLFADDLHYARLPSDLVAKIDKTLERMAPASAGQ